MSWQTAFIPGGDPEGTPIISVLAKRTYAVEPGAVTPADRQLPLCTEDLFDEPDNPLYSEVADETDMIVHKPTTDVVIKGRARAPRNKQAYHLDCQAGIGPLHKTVRVFGERSIQAKALRGLVISDPAPFSEMPLGYRRAYGGVAASKNGTVYSYYPNPIGRGFHLKDGFGDAADLAVPNQEDPDSPVTADAIVLSKFEEWPGAPKPASLGWTRRNFYPRYTYAGVLPEFLDAAEESLRITRQTYPRFEGMQIPKMDFRVYQGASEGLWGRQLKGDEAVRLAYMDADHPTFEFRLPADYPVLSLDIGEGARELEPVLQTVVIDMESKLMTMLWRGSLKYGGVEQLKKVPHIEARAV